MTELQPHKEGSSLSLEALPKPVLQSIYHEVTGKTESLSKSINGKGIVRDVDVDQLHALIMDEVGIHDTIVDPTVTVVVRCDGGKSTTYSSWARFKKLQISESYITSDITIKYEFLIQVPATRGPQRLVLSVNIDSSLPMINPESTEHRGMPSEFHYYVRKEWRAVLIQVDYVDFIVAKNFVSVIEKWFSSIEKISESKFSLSFIENRQRFRQFMYQMPDFGFALFMGAYLLFAGSQAGVFQISVGLVIAVIIRSFGSIAWVGIGERLVDEAIQGIIPNVVLLNDVDRRLFDKVSGQKVSAQRTALTVVASGFVTILLNLFSSYLYSRISRGW